MSGEVSEALSRLAVRLAGPDAQATGAQRLSGGASMETWSFAIEGPAAYSEKTNAIPHTLRFSTAPAPLSRVGSPRAYSCSRVGATLRYLMYHLPSIFTRSSTPWPAAAILGAVGLLRAPPVPNTVW